MKFLKTVVDCGLQFDKGIYNSRNIILHQEKVNMNKYNFISDKN